MKCVSKWIAATASVLCIFLQPSAKAEINQGSSNYSSVVNNTVAPTNQPQFDYKDFDFWANQCVTLENAGQYNEALSACEQAIALKPKSKNLDLWTIRGNSLLKLERYADAVASYQQVLKKEPNNSFVLTQQCEALSALGNHSDAIAFCEQALLTNANWGNITPAMTWYNRGLALRKLTRNEEAVTSFERATLINPNYSLALAQKCGALTDLGRYDEAIQACNSAKEKNGDWGKATPAVAWINQAIALTKSGKIKDAVIAYEQGLAINPQDAISWYNQGILLQKIQQRQRALSSFDRAIQINPKFSLALAHKAETLNQLQNYQEALVATESAIAGDGILGDISYAYIWNQRSHALIGLQKYEEALAAAERATILQPKYAEAWNNKGVSLWNLGQYQEAQAVIKKAVDINPEYTQAWFNYGRNFSSLKKYDKAVYAYSKALIGDTSSVDKATLASIWANQGAAYWHLEKYTNAIDANKNAVRLNPDSFEAWYNQGVILLSLEDYNKALNAYYQANRINPNNPYVLTGIGMALAGNGEKQEALQVFEQALNIDPNSLVAQQERAKLTEPK